MADFECYKKGSAKKKAKPKKVVTEEDDSPKDDFPSMFGELFSNINWKIAFILFIIGILIFSDVFIELFLIRVSGAVEGDRPTTKGTIIQLAFYSLSYVMTDLLVSGNVI